MIPRGRKFWLGIIYVISLLAVLVFMVVMLKDKFTEGYWIPWLGAFTAAYITYVMGNAASKTQATNTVTETKSTEITEQKKET